MFLKTFLFTLNRSLRSVTGRKIEVNLFLLSDYHNSWRSPEMIHSMAQENFGGPSNPVSFSPNSSTQFPPFPSTYHRTHPSFMGNKGVSQKPRDHCFPCSQCDKVFRNFSSRWYHVKSIHEKVKLSCYVCGRVYSSKPALQKHQKKCVVPWSLFMGRQAPYSVSTLTHVFTWRLTLINTTYYHGYNGAKLLPKILVCYLISSMDTNSTELTIWW